MDKLETPKGGVALVFEDDGEAGVTFSVLTDPPGVAPADMTLAHRVGLHAASVVHKELSRRVSEAGGSVEQKS
jgi:hypothetical protein